MAGGQADLLTPLGTSSVVDFISFVMICMLYGLLEVISFGLVLGGLGLTAAYDTW